MKQNFNTKFIESFNNKNINC